MASYGIAPLSTPSRDLAHAPFSTYLPCLALAAGRLGAASLSCSTLANSLYSLLGISLVWGGAAGMETLIGQAYGAGNMRLVHLVLVRAVAVCWAIAALVLLLWAHAEAIMLALGQDPAIAVSAAKYLHTLAPSMFTYALADCLQVRKAKAYRCRTATAIQPGCLPWQRSAPHPLPRG